MQETKVKKGGKPIIMKMGLTKKVMERVEMRKAEEANRVMRKKFAQRGYSPNREKPKEEIVV